MLQRSGKWREEEKEQEVPRKVIPKGVALEAGMIGGEGGVEVRRVVLSQS